MPRNRQVKTTSHDQTPVLQDQQNGRRLLGTAAQIVATGVAWYFGLSAIATPLIGVVAGEFTKYATENTSIARSSAKLSKFVNKQITNRLQVKKHSNREEEIVNMQINEGLYTAAAGISAIALASSFLIGDYGVAATAITCSTAIAAKNFCKATRNSLIDTTIGDSLRTQGTLFLTCKNIAKAACGVGFIGRIFGIHTVSTPITLTTAATEIVQKIFSGSSYIDKRLKAGDPAVKIADDTAKQTITVKSNMSIKIGINMAVIIGIALLSFATFGTIGGVVAASFFTPSIICSIALGIGAISGSLTYYIQGKRANKNATTSPNHNKDKSQNTSNLSPELSKEKARPGITAQHREEASNLTRTVAGTISHDPDHQQNSTISNPDSQSHTDKITARRAKRPLHTVKK